MPRIFTVLPGIQARVVTPKKPTLPAPWFMLESGTGTLTTPDLSRATAAALRGLADEVDAAWAEVDRQRGITHPTDTAAVDNLLALGEAGLPAGD